MPDESRFFRFVWRFNALLLLAALLLAAIFLAISIGSDVYFSRSSNERLAEFQRRWEPKTSYSLDPADATGMLDSANSERLFVLTERRTNPTNPQADVSMARNLLVVDEKAGASHWLFGHGERAILDNMWVYDFAHGEGHGFATHVVGLAMVVADADSNHDERIDEGDRQTLFFYRLDGKDPVKILSADKIQMEPSNWQTAKLRFFYQDGKAAFAVSYSLPDLAVASKIPVSDLPKLGKPGKRITKIGFITEPRATDD